MKKILQKTILSHSVMLMTGLYLGTLFWDYKHKHTPVSCPSRRSVIDFSRQNVSDMTFMSLEKPKPTIYVITATYRRQSQLPLLTRMAQTLQLTTNIHWIVSMEGKADPVIVDLLKETPVKNTLLEFGKKDKLKVPKLWKEQDPKGVHNKNVALKWLVTNDIKNGVIYIADDDNTYNYKIFDEIRNVKEVGLIPVGHFRSTGLSSFLYEDGKIVDQIDMTTGRKFNVDWACVVINLSFWRRHETYIMAYAPNEETNFLENLVMNKTMKDFEPLSINKIWAWHTKDNSVMCKMDAIQNATKRYRNSNAIALSRQLLCDKKK